jgi:hypothetical protein
MFSCSRARRVVKVLSASLVESLPLTGAGKGSAIHGATLTFHLHRSSLTEPYGVACAFGVFGDLNDMCFLRSITPDLAASSSVLSGLLPRGQPFGTEALRLLSLNGEVSPTEERVKAMMQTGRDAVFQCAVSIGADGRYGGGRSAAEVADEQEIAENGQQEIVKQPSPKRRGRKPKGRSDSGEYVYGDGSNFMSLDDDGHGAATLKQRGRPPMTRVARRVLKRSQNKGNRAAVKESGDEEVGFTEVMTATEDDGAAEATDVSTAVVDALEGMPSTPPPRAKPKRRRRTKAEMVAARQLAPAARQKPAVDPRAAAVEGELGKDSDVWYGRGKHNGVSEEEEVVAADEEAAVAAQKRRGRRSTTTTIGTDAVDDAVEAAPEKTMKRRGRKPKAAQTTEKLCNSRAAKVTEVDEEVESAVVSKSVEDGVEEEVMAF